MVAKVKVQLHDSQDCNSLLLTASVAGVSDEVEIATTSERVQLTLHDGRILSGINTIHRYVAGLGSKKEQLLGNSPAIEALVAEWLSYKNIELVPITEEQILKISQHLAASTFLLGNTLTLADLVIFGALHRAMSHLPGAQVQRYCNLVRWFDFMQHAVDTTGIFPKVSFHKPAFTPPAPSVVAPKASPSSGSADKREKYSKSAPANNGAIASSASNTPKPAAGLAPSTPATSESHAASSPAASSPAAQGEKKAKKEARKEARKEAKSAEQEVSIDMLDIRVGKVVKVEMHPNADSLYVEDIDLGEEKPRQVVSGLAKFVPIEQMMDRQVVVVTNLKPAKMRDVMSYGMVLCASNEAHDKVDPLIPPKAAPLGDKVTFAGYTASPLDEINPRKKIVEKLKEDLSTDSNVATNKVRNGLQMGHATAEAVVRAGLNLVPYSFTGESEAVLVGNVGVSGIPVQLVRPEERQQALEKVKSEYPDLVMIDFTLPQAVNDNARFYGRNKVPFVMGTTGGDREQLLEDTQASGTYAVIAPQMGKQVVAFQAMMEFMADNFPGAFAGYSLQVTESHQRTKADTSGTAKAIVACFDKLGAPIKESQIVKIRDPSAQLDRMGVPEQYLTGHAYHTYQLTSEDGTVSFEFQHNVRGRQIYAEGTVDAALFLAKKVGEKADKKIYDMVDVLREGSMR